MPIRDMTMSKTDREPIMLVMTLIPDRRPKSGKVQAEKLIFRKAVHLSRFICLWVGTADLPDHHIVMPVYRLRLH